MMKKKSGCTKVRGESSMKTHMVGSLLSSGWSARVSRVLIFTVLCTAFVGLGWFQPTVADAETLQVGGPVSLTTTTRFDTAAYVLMSRITVTAVTGVTNDTNVVLSSITVTASGSATAYNAVRIYLSSTATTTLPTDAIQIGRVAPYSGVSTVIPLIASKATFSVNLTKFIYVLYDMAPGQAPRTTGVTVTSMALGGGADVLSPLPPYAFSSGTLTLTAGGAKATVVSCTDCHGDIATASFSYMDGTRSGTTGSFVGSHNKHVGTMSYDCSACHVKPVTMSHRNGFVNMANPALQYGGIYNRATGPTYSFPQMSAPTMNTCTTVYCHSSGAGTNSTAIWGGSMPTDCTGCHGGNVASVAPLTTNAHDRHIATTAVGWSITCNRCHDATVSADRTIANVAQHTNNVINVRFNNVLNLDSDSPTYNYNPATSGTIGGSQKAPLSAVGACNNVYCHSTGNLTGAAMAPITGLATFKTVTWTGTIGCDGCHGDAAGNAHPVYATGSKGSVTANSHRKHVESSNLGCTYCHDLTTSGTGTLLASLTLRSGGTTSHLNRVEDVSFMLNGGLTGVYNGDKSCSSTYCHGTASASPSWGGTTDCASCHNAATNLSTGTSDTRNRHWQHLETATTATNFLATNRTVAATYDFNCGVCHYNQPHAQGSASSGVTASVSFSIPWSTGSQGGSYSIGTTTDVRDTRNWAYSTSGTCNNIYCHSNGAPLGSGGIFTGVAVSWGKTLALAPNDCSVCHGGRSDSTQGFGPIATNKHSQHINTTLGYNYNCRECHAGTTTTGTTITNKANHVDGTKDVTWYASGFNATGTPYGAGPNCGNIYCHSNGRAATAPFTSRVTPSWNGGSLGCAECHGNSAATLTTDAHEFHVGAVMAAGTIGCSDCHRATTLNNVSIGTYSNHVNNNVTILFSTLSATSLASYNGVLVGTTTTLQRAAGSLPKGACNATVCHGGNSAAWDAATAGNATCVKCHGVVNATPAQYTANTDLAAPGYYSASGPTGTGVDTSGNSGVYSGGVSTWPKVGAHDAHNRGIGGYKQVPITCNECHNVTALNSPGHMDGQTTFSWGTLASTTLSFAMTPTYIKATGSCATNYCHGGAFGAGVIGTDPTPSWTDGTYLANSASAANSADCNKCHLSPPTSNAKFAHGTIPVTPTACTGCHQHSGFGPTHMNGVLYGAGSCDTCHDYDVDPITGDWGRNQQAVEGWGAHAIHISHLKVQSGLTMSAAIDSFGTSTVYKAICGVCHSRTAQHDMSGGPTTTRQITFGDGLAGVNFAPGAALYNGITGSTSLQQAKTCSNVSCHFQASPVWQGW